MKVVFPLASMNVPMHKVHFLVGVNLMGGIPLVEWVEHLGLPGKTARPLLLVMEH